MKKKQISLQYLAGFFDGEGCISLTRTKATPYNRMKSPYLFHINMQLCQMDKDIMARINKEYGGYLHVRQTGIYYIQWKRKDCYRLLKKLYPFLQVKKKRALEVMKFQEHLENFYKHHMKHGFGAILPKKELKYREKTYYKLKIRREIKK